MEAACSLEKGPHFSAVGSVVIRKQPYRASPTTATYLRCGSGCELPASLPSSKPVRFGTMSLASFGEHFVCSAELGCTDLSTGQLGTLSGSSECRGSFDRGACPSVHAPPGRNFAWVRCQGLSGTRVGSPRASNSLAGIVFSDGGWRKIRRSDGDWSPCSSAMVGTMTMRYPALLGSKSQSGRVACLAHGFGAIDSYAQLFCVISLRGKAKRRHHGSPRHLCESSGQSGTGQPVPDEENPEPSPEQSQPPVPPGPGKNADLSAGSPVESDSPELDWRAFRAKLVVTEHTTSSDATGTLTDEEKTSSIPVSSLGKRWAHPILEPEAGCVLIATDKIDGQQSFERSVILLLSPGSSNPREGPYGLILNRPLSCRIKDIKPKDQTLVNFFGNCQVHHGGPLDEDMFLLLHGTQGVKGYRQVIPGVYYGAASGLEEIVKGKRPLDYRFFFGYSGWGVEQLKKEIDAGLWCVAACSTDLITGHSAAGLWEEILMLMGGKYVELSKRPRRRHF